MVKLILKLAPFKQHFEKSRSHLKVSPFLLSDQKTSWAGPIPGPSKSQDFLFVSPLSNFWMLSPKNKWDFRINCPSGCFSIFDVRLGRMPLGSFWCETTLLIMSDRTACFQTCTRAETVAKQHQKRSTRPLKPANRHDPKKGLLWILEVCRWCSDSN